MAVTVELEIHINWRDVKIEDVKRLVKEILSVELTELRGLHRSQHNL